MRRYLLFAPSALLGLLGGLWLLFRPLRLEASAGPLVTLGVALALAAGLLGGAWVLERTLPSFRHASRLLERALARVRITPGLALALAAATAVGEELAFRGALLPLIGVWGQALVFGLLHPATRRGWAYTAYTVVAGVLFGYATLLTGALWAPILAHFVINLQGFWEVMQRHRRRPVPRVEASRVASSVPNAPPGTVRAPGDDPGDLSPAEENATGR